MQLTRTRERIEELCMVFQFPLQDMISI
uniref:Uncharacterized protein n=1 Tax=Rhizophora mucronata TaxID=61149 RepID=A0A2P2N448_RHIMU